jgi:hypothetical protein
MGHAAPSSAPATAVRSRLRARSTGMAEVGAQTAPRKPSSTATTVSSRPSAGCCSCSSAREHRSRHRSSVTVSSSHGSLRQSSHHASQARVSLLVSSSPGRKASSPIHNESDSAAEMIARPVRWAAIRKMRSRVSKWCVNDPVLMPLSRAIIRMVRPGMPCEASTRLTPITMSAVRRSVSIRRGTPTSQQTQHDPAQVRPQPIPGTSRAVVRTFVLRGHHTVRQPVSHQLRRAS